MLTAQNFQNDQVVSVTTYGLVGGSNSFEGTVLGVVSHKTIPSESNPGINHMNLWPNLPVEVQNEIENDYRSYPYLVLEVNGILTYLGLPWINPNSLSVVSSRVVTIQLTDFQDVNLVRLKGLLTFNGYTIGSITE